MAKRSIAYYLDSPRRLTRTSLIPRIFGEVEPLVIEAVPRMEEGGYRHLPVVDDSGRLLGVLSVESVVHYLEEHFPSTIYCLPPDPNVFPRQREGA
jgi:predicted transcriptional regulator